MAYKKTDDLNALIEAANLYKELHQELHELVQKACYEVDMIPGDNVFQLPNMIRKMRKELNKTKQEYDGRRW